jgi:P5-type ATPase cation transporter
MQLSVIGIILYIFLSLCTGFILTLFLYWFPKARRFFLYKFVNLQTATYASVENEENYVENCRMKLTEIDLGNRKLTAYVFSYRLVKYYLEKDVGNEFQPLQY